MGEFNYLGNKYELEDSLGGLVLPIVEFYEKGEAKSALDNKNLRVSGSLKELLEFRTLALKVKPYKEYPFKEIAQASYTLIEEPSSGSVDSPYKGMELAQIAVEMATRKIQREERDREILKIAKELLPTLLKTITLPGLDLLDTFMLVIDGIEFLLEDLLKAQPGLKLIFKKERDKLIRENGTLVRDYHLLPEVIDWNFYLTLRGPEPSGLEQPYKKILKKVYALALEKDRKDNVITYLNAHPEVVGIIVTGNAPPREVELPLTFSDPKQIRELQEECEKRANQFQKTHGKPMPHYNPLEAEKYFKEFKKLTTSLSSQE